MTDPRAQEVRRILGSVLEERHGSQAEFVEAFDRRFEELMGAWYGAEEVAFDEQRSGEILETLLHATPPREFPIRLPLRWTLGFAAVAVLLLALWMSFGREKQEDRIVREQPRRAIDESIVPPVPKPNEPSPPVPEPEHEVVPPRGKPKTQFPRPHHREGLLATNTVYGTITQVTGMPRVASAGSDSTLPIRKGMEIGAGMVLTSGTGDRVEIRFADGSLLRLDYETTIEMPPGDKSLVAQRRPSEVFVRSGRIWAEIVPFGSSSFRVRTDAATATVLGTQFGIDVKPRDPLSGSLHTVAKLVVDEGSVRFANQLGSVVATDRMETTATDATPPTTPILSHSIRRFRLDGTSFAYNLISGGSLVMFSKGLAYPVAGIAFEVNELPLLPEILSSGVEIAGIDSQTPAFGMRISRIVDPANPEFAPFRIGDVIVAIDGEEIRSKARFNALTLQSPGRRIRVEYLRAGRLLETSISLRPPEQDPASELMPNERAAIVGATEPLLHGRTVEVIERLSVLAERRRSAAACNNMGVAYQVLQRNDQAEMHFARAVQLAPNSWLYHRNLAEALKRIGRLEQSLFHGREAARLAPKSGYANRKVAQELSLAGRSSDALPYILRAIELTPENVETWRYAQTVYHSLGRLEEAEQAAKRAIQTNPHYALPHFDYGTFLRVRGRLAEAKAALLAAISADPLWPGPWNHLAAIANSEGDQHSREKYLKVAIATDPTTEVWLRNLANLQLSQNRFEEAEKNYLKCISLDPETEYAYINLSVLYARTNRHEEAIRVLSEAVRNVTTVPELSVRLAAFLRNAKRESEAENVLRRAIRDFPMWPGAYPMLIQILESQGRKAEAAGVVTRWISSNPATAMGKNDLAWFLAVRGERLPYAESLVRRALAEEPANPAFLDTLGWIQFKRGDLQSARASLMEATKLAPANASAAELWHHLGMVEAALGNKPQAIDALERALKLDPNYAPAKAELQRIRAGGDE